MLYDLFIATRWAKKLFLTESCAEIIASGASCYTEECNIVSKTLLSMVIANLAFSTINTILTFTFHYKLPGKYSVGAMIF